MANMLDYVNAHGDMGFDSLPFNEIDNIIFTQLVHLPLEKALPYGEATLPLEQIAEALAHLETDSPLAVMLRKRLELLRLTGASLRFGGLVFRRFVDEVSHEDETQFCAVTALLPGGEKVIAFRGTDLTLAGWKEDFNMAYASPVPAQAKAVAYLTGAAAGREGPLIVLGHSKGGNLAVYASIHCPQAVRRRIRAVYTNDGPGLMPEDTTLPAYVEMTPRIHSFLPQNSLVGLLLQQHEPYTVVHSRAIGVFEHDPFSWQVEGAAFVRRDSLSFTSQVTDATLDAWLRQISPESRQLFVDTLYSIVAATEATTLGGLVRSGYRSARKMLDAARDIPADVRQELMRCIGLLFSAGTESLTTAAREALLRGEKEKT